MTKYSVRYFFFSILSAFLSVSQVNASQFQQDFSGQKIIVGGTGDSQVLLRVVAAALEKKLKGGKIEVPDTIGSTGGIKALVAGRVNLARVARPLLSNEKKHKLSYLLFAKNPVVFVTHPSVKKIESLSYAVVSGIYAGDINNWQKLGGPEHKIYPVTREPGDASLKILHKYYPDFKANVNVAKVMFSTPMTVSALKNNEYTLGYLPLSNVKNTNLRVLKLDGVSPTAKNIKHGKYKLAMPLAIVYKEKPEGLSKVFIDFLFSDEGRKIISDFGAIPVDRVSF